LTPRFKKEKKANLAPVYIKYGFINYILIIYYLTPTILNFSVVYLSMTNTMLAILTVVGTSRTRRHGIVI
jgi:hypothetical protein